MARKPIRIKKSHRGLLHKDLGVPADQPIPGARLADAMKGNPSPAEKKRLVFAQNAKHFTHKRS